jgi:hypothetical protein
MITFVSRNCRNIAQNELVMVFIAKKVSDVEKKK